MSDFSKPACAVCRDKMDHIIVSPNMQTWNQERRFPNVTGFGDGTMNFESRNKYDTYLKNHHQAESATDAPKKVKSGSTVEIF